MNRLTRVIGLCGLPRVGKDSVADFLVAKHHYVKLSFAAALYREVATAYGAEEELLRSHEWKTKPQRSLARANCRDSGFMSVLSDQGFHTFEPLSSRQVLQLWGTEYRRHRDPEYWTKRLDTALKKVISYSTGNIVISDCRAYVDVDGAESYNEAEYVRGLGGSVYEVVRPGAESNGHSSDSKFPAELISGKIANVGDLAALKHEAFTVLGI